MTLHGAGYGLDEKEAFESEVAGLMDAIISADFPPSLTRISFVERNPGRARRLQHLLEQLISGGQISLDARIGKSVDESLRSAGYSSASKPYVFVAMPFADSMDDVFHYGIQNAVNGAGYLCERADQSSFTGDVLDWIKKRIASANLVVADLSTANPNVYLEVGYAWGCGKPTILTVRQAEDLKFDVKGQRCLVYKSIKALEDLLRTELANLGPQGRATVSAQQSVYRDVAVGGELQNRPEFWEFLRFETMPACTTSRMVRKLDLHEDAIFRHCGSAVEIMGFEYTESARPIPVLFGPE